MPILLKPIFTRMFVFLYLLGIVSSIVTVPPFKGAHMYESAPWELLFDVYVLCLVVYYIPCRVKVGKDRYVSPRGIVKAVIYGIVYPLYIIDTFCFVKFGSTLNPSMLLLMGETTSNEAGEFLSSYVTLDTLMSEVGIVMLVPLTHCIFHYVKKRWFRGMSIIGERVDYLEDEGGSRFTKAEMLSGKGLARILCDILIVALMTVLGTMCWQNKTLYAHTMSMETIGDVEHSLAVHPHTEMYQPPMRLAFAIRSNLLIAKQVDKIHATTEHVVVDSCDFKSQNIVLIIGESFNKRHAQLYGYDKKNMPNQMRYKRQGTLVPMQDVVTPWNLTSFVFKHLMTTYCVGDNGDWCDYPLFCQLFREAGYEVTFITNQFLPQAKEAVWDFSGGFFLNEEALSEAQFDRRNTELHLFDEGLLSDYDNMYGEGKAATDKPRLTIFHLMGQHVSYHIRCPKSKKKWDENDYPDDMDMPAKRRRIMSDYDNAVWYNDSVVGQIIKRFKNDDAVIVYLSDHGEEVFGPEARHFFGRMHDSNINKRLADEEFRIPMWIYCTPKYIRRHRDVYRAVRSAKDKKYMSDALSQLLIGLAGIHCPYYKPEYDLLSPQYNENRKRLLKHTVDYDALK